MRTDTVSRTAAMWLGAITFLGLGLRVYGLAYGLPDVQHPDELPILNRALAFAKGNFNPGNFLYPTLYFYALFVWEGLCFAGGRLIGIYTSVGAFERQFFVDPSHVVLAGRMLTTIFGVATIVAVYRFGMRLYDRGIGLTAALLLAVAPFAVRDAHYIKHDVPVTLFIVLAQLGVARLVTDAVAASRARTWIWTGAMAGLALSTQYYAFPVIVPIIVAAVIEGQRAKNWRRASLMLIFAGLASIGAFIAGSPFFLPDIGTAVRDMIAVRQIDVDRAVNASGAFASLGSYARMIATDAVGWPTAVAAVVGFVLALEDRRGAILCAFPLAFLAFLANTVPMTRYTNPLLPSLAVAAAVCMRALISRIGSLRRNSVLSGVLVVGVALPGLFGSLRADNFYRQADTRTLAREFIERVAPAGSTILVQPHSVMLPASHEALTEALRVHLGSERLASIKFQKQLDAAADRTLAYRVLYLGKVTDGGFDPDKIYISPDAIAASGTLQPLRDQQVAYVAVNRYNTENSAFGSLYTALQREAHLLATFSPYRTDVDPQRRAVTAPFFHNTADRIDPALERPGPIVEVWHID